jgi:uncharacterized protein
LSRGVPQPPKAVIPSFPKGDIDLGNPGDPFQNEIDEIVILLLERIRQVIPDVQAVYLYGSRIRGGMHPASDLDVALLLPKSAIVSQLQLAQLQGDLESLAGFVVEISILSLENQIVHCKEVVAGGRLVYAADRGIVDDFEMRTLSGYARLCEDRAPVLEAYTGVR